MEYKREWNYYKLFTSFLFKTYIFFLFARCKRNYCIMYTSYCDNVTYYKRCKFELCRWSERGGSESLRGVYLFVIGFWRLLNSKVGFYDRRYRKAFQGRDRAIFKVIVSVWLAAKLRDRIRHVKIWIFLSRIYKFV